MICLINPRATEWKARIPLSVLSIGASLEGHYEYFILDGNIEPLFTTLPAVVRDRNVKYIGFTVMPGPQLEQSIRLSKLVKQQSPGVVIIWGGYFPTLHTEVVLSAPYVDFVIRDQGDHSFRRLVDSLEHGGPLDAIPGLSYREGGFATPKSNSSLTPTRSRHYRITGSTSSGTSAAHVSGPER